LDIRLRTGKSLSHGEESESESNDGKDDDVNEDSIGGGLRLLLLLFFLWEDFVAEDDWDESDGEDDLFKYI
jgi:hypothetical protein